MTAEWSRYVRRKDLEPEEKAVRVMLPGGRTHRISITDEPDAYRLTAVVVAASIVSRIEKLPAYAWQRNRDTELVGFKIDTKGRLVGEAWAPKVGLTPAEFGEYVHAVAVECDRFKYQLTGSDRE